MSKESWIYVIGGVTGVVALTVWSLWIARPAVTSYATVWQRILAGAMSLYVLAAMLAVGGVAGALFVYFYDRW